jgi:hypothetical protein
LSYNERAKRRTTVTVAVTVTVLLLLTTSWYISCLFVLKSQCQYISYYCLLRLRLRF